MHKYAYDTVDTTGEHAVEVSADQMSVHESGALVFSEKKQAHSYVESYLKTRLVIAPGAWKAAWVQND